MEKKYLLLIWLSAILFSCSSSEPETSAPESALQENVLGQWDFIYNEEEDFLITRINKNFLKQKEDDPDFKIFTLVFRKNFEYHVIHSQGKHSGSYEILDRGTISLSGLGNLEDVQISGGDISSKLILNDGIKVPFNGKFRNDYNDGGCISFLECYNDQYWLRRYMPYPDEDPSLVYYDYLIFTNDQLGIWWKTVVLNRETECIISNTDNLLKNAQFTILAHSSKLLIFRIDTADEAFLYKYFPDEKPNPDSLNLQIVNLKSSGTTNYRYVSLENEDIPVFEDYADCNPEEARIYVPDDVFEQSLIKLNLDDVLDDYVLRSNIEGVTELDLSLPLASDMEKIQDLTGIEAFVNLKKLNVENNALTEVNILTLAELEWLNLNKNQLSSLDCSANKKLNSLKAEENLIAEIDISNSSDLWNLELSKNRLQQIDLSNNPEINDLMLGNNNLSSIDLSQNLKLWDLTLNDNELTSLDLSNQKELWFLGASNNQITDIDLTGAEALQFLSLNQNQLLEIDLTGLTALQEIYVNNNKLKHLVLERKPEMYQIYAENNELSSLDVSSLEHDNLHIRVQNNSLSCIKVNAVQLENHSNWRFDESVVLALDCK
ncbi:leucine-rich repeat domain-containing protein [Salinimicrobium terrae]|uniref:leucine-rich repeat domain-containing protein n=1 Tax=Salinimicrobium terrae TaxID=470866 RepID=UPI0003FAA2C1|nr:hypothetical protein [Salinimicrobium terrae]